MEECAPTRLRPAAIGGVKGNIQHSAINLPRPMFKWHELISAASGQFVVQDGEAVEGGGFDAEHPFPKRDGQGTTGFDSS